MKNTRSRPLHIRFLAALLSVAFICLSFVACSEQNTSTGEDMLAVHFLDVGQGDCELITTPTGETMLIDAGVPESGDDIVDYIASLGIVEIDIFVASHYHADHIGGSSEIFEAFEIESVLVLDCEATTSTAKRLKRDIENEGCEIVYAERGYEFSLGEAEFLTLSPRKITDGGGNDDSIILRMEYMGARYIFTGDAEEEAEQGVLSYYDRSELSADLLKVGHHGSRTSTSDDFLEAVSPSVAVISCGRGNSYGHPHTETVEKLANTVDALYRTDSDGTVVLSTDGKGIYYNVK